MQKGWIKLYRKSLDNDQLFGSSLTFGLFVYLLLQADRKGRVCVGRFQLANLFRAKPSTIYQTLKRLESNNQVTLQSNNQYTLINIVNWRKYQGEVTPKVTAKQQQSNTKQEIRIENIINTTNVVFGKPEINEAFNYWNEAVGLEIISRIQANRNAASNLIKKHGLQKLHQLIDGVALAQGDQYAPRIADFCDLQLKLNQLIAWGQKRNKSNIEVIS